MKSKITLAVVGLVFLFLVLGCGWLDPFSGSTKTSDTKNGSQRDKTITDKAVDTAVGDEKIGIPECDAVLDELLGEAESQNEDEGYIAKAFRKYWQNIIRESIRKSIQENKNEPEKLAAECKKIKIQLDKYKAEEKEKTNQ